jgi:repressor LexA
MHDRRNSMKSTAKQQAVLEFIKQYIAEYKYPPTITEIGKSIGRNRSVVHGYLDRLKEKGLIDWIPNQVRTIRVIKQEEESTI